MISLVGETRRVIVQGVYELFEKEPSTEWADEERINRLVFIGEPVLLRHIVVLMDSSLPVPRFCFFIYCALKYGM